MEVKIDMSGPCRRVISVQWGNPNGEHGSSGDVNRVRGVTPEVGGIL